VGELIDLGEFDDEERRFLLEMANGLEQSVEDAAGQILEMIAVNQKAVRGRLVAAEVTDLALIRARKRGPEKAQ
jgi:hypothetical protein